MNQHFDDVKRLVSKGSQSDSYAKHFAEHFEKGAKLTNKMVREKVKMEIIWKGNPISCSKSFSKLNCTLCMKERLAILKALGDKDDKRRLINSNTELHGACRHKPKFHRFTRNHNPSADDGQRGPERGMEVSIDPRHNGNNGPNFELNICTTIDPALHTGNQHNILHSPLVPSETAVEEI